jgi:hypothetical protein
MFYNIGPWSNAWRLQIERGTANYSTRVGADVTLRHIMLDSQTL